MSPERGHSPFEEIIGKELGRGQEHVVRSLGENLVLKEPNPDRPESVKRYLRSEERIRSVQSDYRKLKSIFGENLLDTDFVIGHDQTDGEQTNYYIQRRVEGDTLHDVFELEQMERGKFLELYRNKTLELFWMAKKALIEFDVPVDLHSENIVEDPRTNKLILVDFGSPSTEAKIIKGVVEVSADRLKNTTEILFRRLKSWERVEAFLEVSPEEKELLDEKYQIDNEVLQEKIHRIEQAAEGMGVSLREDENT